MTIYLSSDGKELEEVFLKKTPATYLSPDGKELEDVPQEKAPISFFSPKGDFIHRKRPITYLSPDGKELEEFVPQQTLVYSNVPVETYMKGQKAAGYQREAFVSTVSEATQKRVESLKQNLEDIRSDKPIEEWTPALPDESYAVMKLAKEAGFPIPKDKVQEFKEKYHVQVSDAPLTKAGNFIRKLAFMQSLPISDAYFASEAVKQVSNILSKDEKISTKVITEPLKEGAYGLSLEMIYGIQSLPIRSTLAGINAGTWKLLDDKLKKKQISTESITSALVDSGITGLFTLGYGLTEEGIKKHNWAEAKEAYSKEKIKEHLADIPKTQRAYLNDLTEAIKNEDQSSIDNIADELIKGGRSLNEVEVFVNIAKRNVVKSIIANDTNIKETAQALLIKQLPDQVLALPDEIQKEILLSIPDIILTEHVGVKEAANLALQRQNIEVKLPPISEQVVPEEIKQAKDTIPITGIKTPPHEEMAGGIGIVPSEEFRENIKEAIGNVKKEFSNLPLKKAINGIGNIIKIYLGNEREYYQATLGKDKGDEIYNDLLFSKAAIQNIVEDIDENFEKIFVNLPSKARAWTYDVLLGIRGKDSFGNIEFGALQRAGDVSLNLKEGTILDDGRIVGKIEEEGMSARKSYRKYETSEDYKKLIQRYPEAKEVIDKYLALEDKVTYTKLGSQIPAFANNVFVKQFNIKREVEEAGGVYLPALEKDARLIAELKNLFRYSTETGRLTKTGELLESGKAEKDLMLVYKQRQYEFATTKIKNDTAAKILAKVIKPIQKGKKPDQGWSKIDINDLGIKKLISENELLFKSVGVSPDKLSPLEQVARYKITDTSPEDLAKMTTEEKQQYYEKSFKQLKNFEAFLSKNNIDLSPLSSYQVPTAIMMEFNLKRAALLTNPNAVRMYDLLTKFNNAYINYISANYLIKPSTMVRNAESGLMQHMLYTLSKIGEGDFIAVKEALKSPLTVLAPSIRKQLKPSFVGGRMRDEIDTQAILMTPWRMALKPMGEVELHFKRALFQAVSNTNAIKAYNTALKEETVNPKDKTQYIKDWTENNFIKTFIDVRKIVDLYTLNYENKPLFLKYLPKTLALFPNFIYQHSRLMTNHTIEALSGIIHKKDQKTNWGKIFGFTLGSGILATILYPSIQDRKKQREKLAINKVDSHFDTTGKLKFYVDDEVEKYLRVYDLGWAGDIAYFMDMAEGNADIGDYITDRISLGPFAKIPLAFFTRNKKEMHKSTSSVLGSEFAGQLPFSSWLRYVRIMNDPIMRKQASSSYNWFVNFIAPSIDVIPGASKILEPSIKEKGFGRGEIRKYNTLDETLKFYFNNIQTLDKEEVANYEREQIESGKVVRRMLKKAKERR